MDVSSPQRIIAIIGPESTGKTTLATQLAAHFDADLVQEYAREYLANLNRPYQEHDLLLIARGQFEREQQIIADGNPTVICDTDLLVMQVWSEVRYDVAQPAITDMIPLQRERFYLLMRPDLPWEPDPLRENPDDREHLFERYEELLNTLALPYAIVDGTGDNRFKNALNAISAAKF